jgi:hypothetical protein
LLALELVADVVAGGVAGGGGGGAGIVGILVTH